MILYIIRHADPDYENNTITPFGWEEAHALADWLKDKPIDKIYTSPMGRAIDTAAPTCKIKGMESTILPWTAEKWTIWTPINYHSSPSAVISFLFKKALMILRILCLISELRPLKK